MGNTYTCKKCGRSLPRTDAYFYRDKWTHAIDGLKYTCKECSDAKRKANKKPPKWESELKWCYMCKEFYPRTEAFFYKSPKRIDGLDSKCKKCALKETERRHKENPEKRKAYCKKTIRNQWNNNINFRLAVRLRNRMNNMLRNSGTAKHIKMSELMGGSVEDIKNHIESQFMEGMTWGNHGVRGWHIDHIKPCASFDLTDIEEQKKCFHFTNLQPLWAHDNLVKNGRIL